MIFTGDERFEREISENSPSWLERRHEEIMPTLLLSFLMPRPDEEETLETSIRKAQGWLSTSGLSGEVLLDYSGSMRHHES